MYMHDAFKIIWSFLSVVFRPISTERFPSYPVYLPQGMKKIADCMVWKRSQQRSKPGSFDC